MSSPESSSSFGPAFLFLPPDKREALSAVYAFCRLVDDAVDAPAGARPGSANGELRREIEFWRAELERLYAGRPAHAVSRRLLSVVERFHLPPQPFLNILEGVEMDLTLSRYDTFEQLEPYLFRVASSVGLLCIEIFGYRNPTAKEYARHLGHAFQMTNILRDIGADSGRGRLYIPLEDLRRFGISEAEVFNGVYSPAWIELMRFEYSRTKECYGRARAALPPEDRSSLLPAEVMAAVYEGLLEKIRRAGFDVFRGRISLGLSEKLACIGRMLLHS